MNRKTFNNERFKSFKLLYWEKGGEAKGKRNLGKEKFRGTEISRNLDFNYLPSDSAKYLIIFFFRGDCISFNAAWRYPSASGGRAYASGVWTRGFVPVK